MKKYHPTRLSEILAYVMDALVLFVVYMFAVHGAPGQAFPWSLFLLYVPGVAMNCWLHIRARDSISVDSDEPHHSLLRRKTPANCVGRHIQWRGYPGLPKHPQLATKCKRTE